MKKVFAYAMTGLIAPILVFMIGQSIYDRVASTSSIEYRITYVGELLYPAQGAENRVRVEFDGKPYKNVKMLRLELFNRSTKSLSDLPIHIHLAGGTAKLLGKMLIYPTEQGTY